MLLNYRIVAARAGCVGLCGFRHSSPRAARHRRELHDAPRMSAQSSCSPEPQLRELFPPVHELLADGIDLGAFDRMAAAVSVVVPLPAGARFPKDTLVDELVDELEELFARVHDNPPPTSGDDLCTSLPLAAINTNAYATRRPTATAPSAANASPPMLVI